MFKTLFQTFTAAVMIVVVFTMHSCIKGPVYHNAFSVSDITEPPHVRVGLSRALSVPSVRITVEGHYRITPVGADRVIAEGKDLMNEQVIPLKEGISIGKGLTVYEHAAAIVPYKDGSILVGDQRYRGALLIYNIGQLLSLVNDVEIESYLAGVIPKELNLSVDPDALKAQTIAARTYALYEMRNRIVSSPTQIFDLYDDQRSQVYGGMCDDTAYAESTVLSTRGTVLTYGNNLIKAFYASTCGGATEPAWEVFEPAMRQIVPLSGRPCGYCTGSKYFEWEATLTKQELIDALFPGKKEIKDISAIRVEKRMPGGHVKSVAVKIPNQANEIILNANDDFRHPINRAAAHGAGGQTGKKVLRSAMFEIVPQRDSFRFIGKGFGHAVGMCQVGACEMGRRGISYGDILRYYYPGAVIVKLY